jgi:ABC-type transport system involved in multi-copper enzyme maturation permease subunit
MMANLSFSQIAAVARLEIARAFLSRRGLWVYLIALFPMIVFGIFGVVTQRSTARLQSIAVKQPFDAAKFTSLPEGSPPAEALKVLGPASEQHEWTARVRETEIDDEGRRKRVRKEVERESLMWTNGRTKWGMLFEGGKLTERWSNESGPDLPKLREVFAGCFHYYYLRLAIFFGCLGIFMNLFRGDVLDKTLHYWFLAPVSREVLLLGKYSAGALAACVIFPAGLWLAWQTMLWSQPDAAVAANAAQLRAQILGMMGVTALGCLAYGALFLAAGMVFRNPIIPAVSLLFWEALAPFLPDLLQKLSVRYYLQSMSPVPAPLEADLTMLQSLLLAPAEPANAMFAIVGVVALTMAALLLAARAVRRMEVNYSAES